MKEKQRTNRRTKAFGYMMLSLKEMNKIHTQTMVTQMTTRTHQAHDLRVFVYVCM